MAFDPDSWESTKKMLKGVGRGVGKTLKFAGETLYEGYALGADKPQRYPVARQSSVVRPLPARKSSGASHVPSMKSLKGFKVHNPYSQGRKATHNQLISNPFPAHVSEELGIPHRQKISAREYELIRKDMIRRGLH